MITLEVLFHTLFLSMRNTYKTSKDICSFLRATGLSDEEILQLMDYPEKKVSYDLMCTFSAKLFALAPAFHSSNSRDYKTFADNIAKLFNGHSTSQELCNSIWFRKIYLEYRNFT